MAPSRPHRQVQAARALALVRKVLRCPHRPIHPGFLEDPGREAFETKSMTREGICCGAKYFGEIKKSIFLVMA